MSAPPRFAGSAWRPRLVLCAVGSGAALGPLDTAVNIAFPDITGRFAIPLASIQWVIICYVLTYASLLLNFGRAADIVGHRRIFVLGVVLSAGALAACGLAPSYEWLLAARGLQGLGTALVLAAGPALVTLSFPEASRGRALGGYGVFLTGAAALGPLAGGILVEQWGWPAVFWFRVPIALAVLGLVALLVRDPAPVRAGQRFDFPGAVSLSIALVATLLWFNRANSYGWLEPATLGLAGMAVCAVAAFVWVERRAAEPVIDLSLFRARRFVIGNVAHVLSQLAAFTVLLLSPYFLVRYTGGDVARAGVLLAISPIGGAIASLAGGGLVGRFGSWRLSTTALGLAALGLGGVALWSPAVPVWAIALTLLVQGAGHGLFQLANMDYVMGTLDRSRQGVAGALTMLTRTLGVVLGATLGSLLFVRLGGGADDGLTLSSTFMSAYRGVFLGAVAVSLTGLALMWWARGPARPPR